jgi:hypothetical protein
MRYTASYFHSNGGNLIHQRGSQCSDKHWILMMCGSNMYFPGKASTYQISQSDPLKEALKTPWNKEESPKKYGRPQIHRIHQLLCGWEPRSSLAPHFRRMPIDSIAGGPTWLLPDRLVGENCLVSCGAWRYAHSKWQVAIKSLQVSDNPQQWNSYWNT